MCTKQIAILLFKLCLQSISAFAEIDCKNKLKLKSLFALYLYRCIMFRTMQLKIKKFHAIFESA